MVTLDPTSETFWEGTDEFAPAVLTSSLSNTVSTIGELLDMTTQPPTSLGATPGTGGSQYDAALAPAGNRAFIATGNSPFAVTEYAVSATPTLTRSYPLASSPHAVAGSASGLFQFPFSNGTFSLGVSAGEDKKRKNDRSFDLVEDFAQLLADRTLVCGAEGQNWKYPITGEIGLREVIETYVRLSGLKIFTKPTPSSGSGSSGGGSTR